MDILDRGFRRVILTYHPIRAFPDKFLRREVQHPSRVKAFLIHPCAAKEWKFSFFFVIFIIIVCGIFVFESMMEHKVREGAADI